MSAFLISQILAAVAFFFGIISFQFKDRRAILLCWFGSSIANGVHFYILGQNTPALISFVTGLRFFSAAYTIDKRVMFLYMGLTVGAFLVTYAHPIALLPFIAALNGTYACFQGGDRYIRILLMFSTALWVVHNVFVGSPVAVVMEISFLASNVMGFIRYYVMRKAEDSV